MCRKCVWKFYLHKLKTLLKFLESHPEILKLRQSEIWIVVGTLQVRCGVIYKLNTIDWLTHWSQFLNTKRPKRWNVVQIFFILYTLNKKGVWDILPLKTNELNLIKRNVIYFSFVTYSLDLRNYWIFLLHIVVPCILWMCKKTGLNTELWFLNVLEEHELFWKINVHNAKSQRLNDNC